MNIIYKINVLPKAEELMQLYNDVGWYTYTKDAKRLERAFANSKFIASAWDGDKLVGVLRAVGDSETIMYIQDVLIQNKYQRKGIGHQLMTEFINKYKNIRKKVLITDKTLKTMSFYKSCGFVPTDAYDEISYVNYTF